MCGFAGVLHGRVTRRLCSDDVLRMCRLIAHRGPDEHGTWEDRDVVLGHRRLSIIDIASGQQPMKSPDGDVVLVYNGEVYNHGELRRELEHQGQSFRTRSDTEAILGTYRAHGLACTGHLRGMFAFALWDARKRRLLLVRDRLGIKPLYYAFGSEYLVFASELKALMASGVVHRDIDPQALDDFLAYGFIRSPRSIFRDVKKLLPGEQLAAEIAADGQLRLFRHEYWRPPTPAHTSIDYETAKTELENRIHEAVRLRLMSEVPLGAFLSGGIDSSTVVWSMARQMTQPVRTFSIGFHEPRFDERDVARAVALHFGTEHHEEIVTPDAVAILPELSNDYDEPFGDPSAIPTWYLCRMARKHVTVSLSGDGGDELFAGYARYATLAAEQQRMPVLSRLLSGAAPLARCEGRLRNRLERAAMPLERRYGRFRNNFSPAMRAALYSEELRRLVDLERTQDLFQRFAAPPEYDPLSRMQLADLQGYLPDDVLTKVDRASMAHSLEARVPLLDHQLVAFVQGLPVDFKVRGQRSKAILRDIIEPHMPPPVLRHPKRGFSVPLGRWLRNELAPRLRQAVRGPTFQKNGWFDGRYVRRLETLHMSGRVDLSFVLWQLLVLDVWWQQTLPGLATAA
ncbi:MAG: asparagine synthase (glutamine-hydrolyzing) [Polyangiaceae bacterium]|nr:asparagine synthase (glutamine-hydrolyzing) [Polyangiaceae bacterium]